MVANRDVSFALKKGQIYSILGENGSGKTTLMNALVGIYKQDEGKIFINGEEANINSPRDAYRLKIGMIHQHFKLVDVFSATENILLGLTKEDFKLFNIDQIKSIDEEIEKIFKIIDTEVKKSKELLLKANDKKRKNSRFEL